MLANQRMSEDPFETTAVIPIDSPSAASFRNLVENNPHAVFVHDGGRVVYVNAAAVRWTEAGSADRMLGTLITDFVHPEAILGALAQTTTPGQPGEPPVPVTSVLLRRDRTTLDVEAITVPADWEGRSAYQTVLRDIPVENSVHSAAAHSEALLQDAPAGIIGTTDDGVITVWNRSAEALYGVSAGDAVGHPIGDAVGVPVELAAIVAGGGTRNATHYTAAGSSLSVRVWAAAVQTGYLLVCADRTAEHHTAEHFQSVVTCLDRGIVVMCRDGRIASINPAAVRILGTGGGCFPSSHSERTRDFPLFDTDGTSVPVAQRPAAITLRTGQSIHGRVFGIRRHDGHQAWISVTTTLLDPDDAEHSPVVVALDDVTTEHLANLQLRRSAHHDALTGLPNRARTLAMITAAITPSDNPQLAALMFIDIDQLKRINDSLGHHAGDVVLRTCADRLNGAIRVTDTLTRVGGDEFVLLIGAPATANDLHQLAGRLHEALKTPTVIDAQPITVSASIGITVVDTARPATPADILSRADAAMYQAKTNGPGQTCFYSPKDSAGQRRHTGYPARILDHRWT
ncbi:MAG: sensor domain-containing diguanylate cyclase [Mycobacterium sp.]|nr:sensor domain-containing diguanylate cyclase [Mycobacterium sp.]